MRTVDVVVIGGGISGLSVAWWLRQQGIDVIVLEKEQVCGGNMKTVRENGWLIERGPTSALETTPLFATMFDALGIMGERVYANQLARKRYIVRNGKLHTIPMSPGQFLATDLLSLKGKLRLLKEPFVGKTERDESVAEFIQRRLGSEFLDYAVDPFVAGVYAGTPENLSIRAAFPKLFSLEERHGGLVKGIIRERKERRASQASPKGRAKLFTFKEGMATFPAALARSLGERVRTGCEICDVGCEGGGYNVIFTRDGEQTTTTARVVVLSAPAHAVARMIAGISPGVSERIDSISYPPVGEVFLGFRKDQIRHRLDGFGFLVPAKENRKILGTIWSSSLFEGRAPDGQVALTAFVGGARQPEILELDDDKLSKVVIEELRAILGIIGEPTFMSITRWKKAIPQYSVGYEKTLKSIEDFESQNPGAFICSNFRGGVAIGDCVVSSEKAAARILDHLNRTSEYAERRTVTSEP